MTSIACLKAGAQIALVIGGGNIFRGVAGAAKGMDRVSADHMGILATVMNALAMQGVLQGKGIDARVLSAIAMPTVCETYSRDKAVHHLDAGQGGDMRGGHRLAILYNRYGCGAARRRDGLRCAASRAPASMASIPPIPSSIPRPQRFERLTYSEILARDLRIMDPAAIALARDNGIPVVVFSIRTPGAVLARLARQRAVRRL